MRWGEGSAPVSIMRRLFSFQAEDEALLSEEDDPIDRRPWTQQHLEAADIRRTPSLALTPPQAEQEVDVLDVNVRGPGQHPLIASGCLSLGVPCLVVVHPVLASRAPDQPRKWLLQERRRADVVTSAGKQGVHPLSDKENGPIKWAASYKGKGSCKAEHQIMAF